MSILLQQAIVTTSISTIKTHQHRVEAYRAYAKMCRAEGIEPRPYEPIKRVPMTPVKPVEAEVGVFSLGLAVLFGWAIG